MSLLEASGAPRDAGHEASRRLRALLEARAPADALVWATVPAPLAAPEVLLELFPAARAAAFLPAGGGAGLAAVGEALVLTARGPGRMITLARDVEALGARFERRGDGPGPRLVGGAAFAGEAPRAAPDEGRSPLSDGAPGPWAAFGEAALWLGRWTYVVEGGGQASSLGQAERASPGRAWLAACVSGAALEGARDALAGEVAKLVEGLGAAPATRPTRAPHGVAAFEAAAVVEARVARAVAAIERGEAEKLVVATHARVRGLAGVADVDVLARLAGRGPGVRFLLRAGGASFVGATPERLVARRGAHVSADALAGSAPPALAETLLASDKDRREHALVVGHLVLRLGAAGVVLAAPAPASLRVLATVAHLHTPIEGTIAQPRSVLELGAALHPTPAVAGLPTAAAAAWLAREEPIGRGWYAGPVGWVTPDGDGELVVALRSGLLVGDEALCLAGAGIVRGSAPVREREEMALKLRVMLDALGAEARG